MTNILPQAKEMNRGAWLHTEEIIECVRDIEPLHVVGGAFWDRPPGQGRPVTAKHGVEIPVSFWKVVFAPQSGRMIGWIVPNDRHATRRRVDDYLATVNDIEQLVGEAIAVPAGRWEGKEARRKQQKPSKAWAIPRGCHKG